MKGVGQHNCGTNGKGYTYERLPVQLVYYCQFTNVEIAIEKEKQIKKWSRAKKEALINGEFTKLKVLSKKKLK